MKQKDDARERDGQINGARLRSISRRVSREDVQEVGDLVKLARTNSLVRQTRDRSVRANSFGTCSGNVPIVSRRRAVR